MKFDKNHAAIILEQIFERNDEYEQIDLVSESDKRRIPIHRFILMAASKFFAGLLRTNDLTEMPNEFVLDSNGEVIETVVEFCYTGVIHLTEQNVENCLKIAVDEGIELLLNKCHDYYSATLSTENVVDVLMTADKYNLNDLQQCASELLCSQLEQVSATQICQLNPTRMLYLMEGVDDTIADELVVNRLLSWFQYDETQRAEHMPKMLRLIQLEKLSSKFLAEMIEPIFKQFKCVDLLYNEFKRRSLNNTPCCGCAPVQGGGDGAVMIDRTAIFRVTETFRNYHIVQRYDESLGKLKPHFTTPQTDIGRSKSVLYENKIFMIGGCEHGRATDSMIAYDMSSGEMEQLRPMNEHRYYLASIMMGESIYVFGGRRGIECLSSCERYDIDNGTWQTIKSMNHKRYVASAAILNGLIYVVGGLNEFTRSSNLVESYDPKTDEWTVRMPLDKGKVRPALATFNGRLYAFLIGHGVREYDPVKNIWLMIRTQYKFRTAITANGSLFAVTVDGKFGRVTIEDRKIEFSVDAAVERPFSYLFSLHQCRFEK